MKSLPVRLIEGAWSAGPGAPLDWLGRLLAPVGWIYGGLMAWRARTYARGWLSVGAAGVPVIGLGNLELGGLGKTPLAIHLVGELRRLGFKPAVVLRGYGGRVGSGPRLVKPQDDPAEVGDEALLLAGRTGAVVVAGADRAAGAALARENGADAIILDDGFQHLALARDLNLVLLDAARPLANGRTFPAGRLREGGSALSRADAIILTRCPAEEADQARARLAAVWADPFHRPVFTAAHRLAGVVDPRQGRPLDLAGKSILVAAGVARPQTVVDDLAAWEPRLAKVASLPLADHQPFGPGEVARIERAALAAGADVTVVTAKDWVKLEKIWPARLPLGVAEMELSVREAEEFRALVGQAAAGRGAVPGVTARSARPLPETGRLLVRLPNWVGDAVLAAPVIENLRLARPRMEIHLLATPWVADLYAHDPRVNGVVVYEPRGRHAGLPGRMRLGRELASRFDLGLLLPNSFDSALVFRLAGLRRIVGFSRDGRGWMLSDAVPAPPVIRRAHMVEYYLALLTSLNLPVTRRWPELHVSAEGAAWAGQTLAGLGDGPFIGLAPGAAFGPAKRWPAGHFARAARRLAEEMGARVLILGSADDAATGDEIAAAVGPAVVNLAGRTSLAQAVALAARLELMLVNDSGLMHLAAALGTPVVALFGPTDPARTGPRSRRSLVLTAPAPCAPCLKTRCDRDDFCLARLDPEEVAQRALAFIGPRPGSARPGSADS